MADQAAWAVAKWDGRNADTNTEVPFAENELYQDYQPGDYFGVRPKDGSGGPPAGKPWKTPSAGDKLTVLAELHTVTYKGKPLPQLLVEMYQVIVEGQAPADVLAAAAKRAAENG